MAPNIDPIAEARRLEVLRAYAVLDTVSEEGYDRITRLAAKLLQVPVALVSLLDENRQWFKSCYGMEQGTETSREVSFCAHAIYQADPLVIADATQDERFSGNPYVVGEPKIRFYAGIPLTPSDDACLGTLCIVDMHARTLGDAELDLLQTLAAMVCDELRLNKLAREAEQARDQILVREAELRVLNESLESQVHHRTEALRIAHREILHRLARAAAYRDNDTGDHVQRMSLYCHIIAREAGLDATFCQLLREASPLHDIGKIGIPDEILLKPGRYTPEEMEEMKRHVEIGGSLLVGGQTELIQLAEMIALTHHERWDGTGYPAGLKGDAIPLAGRIAAIADVFDALTSARPYKEAWSVERAASEIVSQAGKQFDPSLVEAFSRALPSLAEFVEKGPGSGELRAA